MVELKQVMVESGRMLQILRGSLESSGIVIGVLFVKVELSNPTFEGFLKVLQGFHITKVSCKLTKANKKDVTSSLIVVLRTIKPEAWHNVTEYFRGRTETAIGVLLRKKELSNN